MNSFLSNAITYSQRRREFKQTSCRLSLPCMLLPEQSAAVWHNSHQQDRFTNGIELSYNHRRHGCFDVIN